MDAFDAKRMTDAELVAASALLTARVAARTAHNVASTRSGARRYTVEDFIWGDRVYQAIQAELKLRGVL